MDTSHPDSLLGKWVGTSRLFLGEDVFDSETSADIRTVGQGQFVSLSYTWRFEDGPQDGHEVLAVHAQYERTAA